MKNLFKKRINQRIIILLIVCFAVFFYFNYAKANIVTELLGGTANVASWGLYLIMGAIIQGIAWFVGQIITVITDILLSVAQYSTFIDNNVVKVGWPIVRDICNMFFILILLVIAFATILRIESYSWKKNLPKLLIMAVLINFSKTICGLAIDFAQVIMLTFVNGFAATGAGNLFDAFGLGKIFEISNIPNLVVDKNVSGLSVFGSLLLGLMILIIAGIIIGVFTIILAFRIVMLWILIILSPLAFLAMAIPAGAKYASQWMDQFTKNLIIGPILAFFLWLSLVTVGQIDYANFGGYKNSTSNTSEVTVSAALTTAGSKDNLTKFIVSCCLLIGGLMMAQQMGGAAGNIAGKGMAWAKKSPMLLGKGAMGVGGWAGRKFALGIEYGKPDEEGKRKTLFKGFEIRPTKIYQGIKEGLADKTKREEGQVQAKAGAELRGGRLLGALGASRDFTESAAGGLLWHKAWMPSEKGAIFSTIKAGKANKRLKELEEDKKKANSEWIKDPDNNDKRNEVKKIEKEIERVTKEYEQYKAPYTFFADAKRMEIINEQGKKLGDNDNEEDLVEKFMDAAKQGNKELASSIFLHAAKVGHSNEMLEMVPALKNVENSKGEVITEKGQTFRADNAGLRGMVDQYFVKKLGMSEQEAYSIQNQFSVLAKKVNHYNLSESIGVRNGLLYQRNDETQMKRAHGEMMKRDVEQLLRQFNRLGHGGELQYKIGEEDIRRVADFNQQAEATFFKLAPSWDQEVNDRQRLNPNYAQNLYNTFKIEQEIEGVKDINGDKQLAENSALEKAITGSFRSISKALEDSGNKKRTFLTKGGAKKTYEQLVLETLVYGKSKYEAATFADLQAKIASAKTDDEKEKFNEEFKKEEKISKAIGNVLEAKLEKYPKEVKKKKEGEGEEPGEEGGAKEPTLYKADGTPY